jgi:hypothetical protein
MASSEKHEDKDDWDYIEWNPMYKSMYAAAIGESAKADAEEEAKEEAEEEEEETQFVSNYPGFVKVPNPVKAKKPEAEATAIKQAWSTTTLPERPQGELEVPLPEKGESSDKRTKCPTHVPKSVKQKRARGGAPNIEKR